MVSTRRGRCAVSQLLEVKNLTTTFKVGQLSFKAVDDVNFSIFRGKTVRLVGESGCGKSITSLSLLRMIDSPGKIEKGEVWLNGRDILKVSEAEMRKIRGNEISMVFQEPMSSLNPVFPIGEQIAEVFRIHRQISSKDARDKAVEMLRLVNMASPEKRAKEYPHLLSGGMRQRVMIAMALACNPDLLIADEPTTALDVTIQAQILDLMSRLQEEIGMAIFFITHDLGLVAEVCDHVLVMYAGKIIEAGSVREVFQSPMHPYTQGLLASIPRLGRRKQSLPTIGGSIPSLWALPKGCRFSNRCPYVKDVCKQIEPTLKPIQGHTQVACWLYESDSTGNNEGTGTDKLA